MNYRVDHLVQDCSNSIANALELLQPFTKPPMWRSDDPDRDQICSQSDAVRWQDQWHIDRLVMFWSTYCLEIWTRVAVRSALRQDTLHMCNKFEVGTSTCRWGEDQVFRLRCPTAIHDSDYLQGSVSRTVFRRNANSTEISSCSLINSYKVIATKFCACHDSCVSWHVQNLVMIWSLITTRQIFHRIRIVSKRSFVPDKTMFQNIFIHGLIYWKNYQDIHCE